MNKQIQALKEYCSALQHQNETIMKEQNALYRQIQALRQINLKLQKYYYQYRDVNKENTLIKQQMAIKNTQIQALTIKLSESSYNDTQVSGKQLDEYRNIIQNLQSEIGMFENQLMKKNQNIQQYMEKMSTMRASESKVKQELQEFKKKYFQEKNKNIQNLGKLRQSQSQCQELRTRLNQSQVQRLENSLQELAENYQKIQLVVLQKEQRTRQMQEYINELEYQCQILNQQYIAKYQYSQQLQYQIECLQVQLNNKRIIGEMSQDGVSMLTESISKINLIKQNNRMVEKIANIQKENANKNNDQERYSYSECGANYSSNSPSKLQMRIQTLKMQNQNLIRTLAI